MTRQFLRAAVLAAVCATFAVQAKGEKAVTSWPQLLTEFQEGYFALHPPFAASQGRHEFDGKLPDWSAAGIAGQHDWLRHQAKRAKKFRAAKLTPQQEYEREYLLSRIDHDLFWLEVGTPFTNPAFYLDELDPDVYLSRPYAPAETRIKAYIAYLEAVPAAATQIRANLKLPLAKTLLERGVGGFAGYAEFYRGDAQKAFISVKDAKLQDQLRAATEPAARAMQELADWLKADLPKATNDFALGPKRFAEMLWRTERVKTPVDELYKIGLADLQRNQAALKEACGTYLPGSAIKDCINKMASQKPKGGPVVGARRQLTELRQFLVDHKLVTIPGTELALVDEAPPYKRANFAYIIIPGPFEKNMPSTYYISPPDPSWPKAEQDAYVPGEMNLMFTSVHEVWPGHFLQFLHANRSPFEFGRLFVGYAFAEGWAHYTEELMWDAGFGNGSVEVHIGQISQALTRNGRYLCAIGLHTRGMTVQECETLFLEQAYKDPGTSRQQASRGTYDPAYLNYTLGKLMIRKLRDDWTATRGGREAWPAFHDAFLSYGGPPIPLVREQMMGKGKGELL
jgi:hypothetical protein